MEETTPPRPPSRPALHIWEPGEEDDIDSAPETTPEPSSPPIWRAIRARIENLSLRVQAGTFSKDNFKNIKSSLERYEAAWCVFFADSSMVMVPKYGLHKDKLEFEAGTEDEAITQARKLSGKDGEVDKVVKNGDRAITDSKNDDLSRWLNANPQWLTGHTKTNNLVIIFECFRWFEDEEGVKNPYKRSRMPKFVRKSRREAKEKEYIALMRNGCRELRRAMWCLWNLVGIRPGEMRGMLWADFDWEGEFVLTYEHKTARATNKPRVFVLTKRQGRFFRNLFKQRPTGSTHVFLNTEGKPWTRRALGLNIRRTAKRIGLDDGVIEKVSAGQFRQAFATQADEAGCSEQDTAMLMGHQSTDMLRTVYSKASRKVRHHRAAAERAERLRREARRNRGSEDVQGELF